MRGARVTPLNRQPPFSHFTSDIVGLQAPAKDPQAQLREVVDHVFALRKDMRRLNELVADTSRELIAGGAEALKDAVSSDSPELLRLAELSSTMCQSLRVQYAEFMKDPRVKSAYNNERNIGKLRQDMNGFASETARDFAEILCPRGPQESHDYDYFKSQSQLRKQICEVMATRCEGEKVPSFVTEGVGKLVQKILTDKFHQLINPVNYFMQRFSDEGWRAMFDRELGSSDQFSARLTALLNYKIHGLYSETSGETVVRKAGDKICLGFKEAMAAKTPEGTDFYETFRRDAFAALSRQFRGTLIQNTQVHVARFMDSVALENEVQQHLFGVESDLPRLLAADFSRCLTSELEARGKKCQIRADFFGDSGQEILPRLRTLFNPQKINATRRAVLGE